MTTNDMHALLISMMLRTAIQVVGRNGLSGYGVVNQIQAEDGSGKNFNVTLDNGTSFFVKVAR